MKKRISFIIILLIALVVAISAIWPRLFKKTAPPTPAEIEMTFPIEGRLDIIVDSLAFFNLTNIDSAFGKIDAEIDKLR